LEDLTTTRERNSEKAVVANTTVTLSNIVDDRRTGSSSLRVSTSKQNPSPPPVVAQVQGTIDEQPRPSTSSSPTRVVSSDNEGKKFKVEMDDDDVTIVPPITNIQTTSPNPPDAERDIQLTDESRNCRELEPPSDVETQRQRQREARRGPTPSTPSFVSSSQITSRKTSPVVLKTGMKRNRNEYEEGQVVDEEDQPVGIDNPDIVPQGEQRQKGPFESRTSAETEAIHTDLDNSEEDGEIVIMSPTVDLSKTRRSGNKVSTVRKQVTPHMEVQARVATFPIANDPNPKALGRWAYYRDSVGVVTPSPARSFITQPSMTPPSPQARLPKKLGINHMDLLYKTEKETMVCRICL
jgi:hypothetical protein